MNDHSRLCVCAVCSLARMHDATADRDSQRAMADRWASIEGLLSDTERETSSDRDHRTSELEAAGLEDT